MEKLSIYKKVFYASLSMLCVVLSVAITAYALFETRWFATSYILQCDGDKYGASFALIVDTKNEDVLFEGRGKEDDTVERRIIRFSDTQIGMSWDLDSGKKTQLWISRVNNTMKMWRDLENGEKDKSLDEVNGRCYVASTQF